MRCLFYFIFIAWACTACQPGPTGPVAAEPQADSLAQFRKFISRFRMLPLPFRAETGCYAEDTTVSVRIDPDEYVIRDTPYAITIGMLPDTSRFYALLVGVPATCYMPVLYVYSKNGVLTALEQVSSGCGGGCGYLCSDSLVIRSMQDITNIYSQESYECDSTGNETPGTWERKTEIKRCAITETGRIEVNMKQSSQKR